MRLAKILCNEFGFTILRQKGSHMTLQKDRFYVTIPAHDIGIGLLSAILNDAGIDRNEYLKHT